MTLTRRPVEEADASFLRALVETTRPELSGLPEAERDRLLDLQCRAQASDWGARFSAGGHELVLLGGDPVGRLWVARMRRECRIVDLTLLPEHRRAGLGSRLVAEVLLSADEAGLPTRLSVLRENKPALAFWRGRGFLEVQADAFYLGLERRALRGWQLAQPMSP